MSEMKAINQFLNEKKPIKKPKQELVEVDYGELILNILRK